MDIKFNPQIAPNKFPNQAQNATKPICKCACETCGDKLEVPPPVKKPFFERFKDGVKSAWNFCINTSEMTKGTISGIANGLAAGAGIMGLDWIITASSKVAKKELKLADMLKQPFKLIGNTISNVAGKISKLHTKSVKDFALYIIKIPNKFYNSIKSAQNVSRIGKIAAPVVGLLALGATLVNAKMRANEKTADVDHKLKTGHRPVEK